MNFFDRQAVRQRQSAILLVCFVLVMLCMGTVIHIVIAALSTVLDGSASFWRPSAPALALIGLVWMTLVAGAFFRYLDIRGGGAVLARRFGAVHASDRSRFDGEQRLLNVVAEMAIASSTPQPEVFVLRNEGSINAMVLGSEESRHAVVVTQGALEAFDRDELQAVIAHEFAHIRNGDLPMNMRLLMALGGLMAIDEVGQLLVGNSSTGLRNLAANQTDDDPSLFHPGVLVGYLLRALGSIGVIAGQLIQSAFSRQREYLADAMAAQFTRNPFALASALDVIRQREAEPPLHSVHSHELAHLCFQSNLGKQWYKRLTASHPDINLRIDAIDRHFAVKQRKARKVRDESRNTAFQAGQNSGNVAAFVAVNKAHVTGSHTVENGASQSRVIAHDVLSRGLSDRILLLLPDENSCLAALFALFVSSDDSRKCDYFNALTFGFNKQFADSVRKIATLIPDELHKDQLSIVEHTCSVLRNSITHQNRQRVLRKLERLLTVSGDYDLMRYATLQLIRRKLDVEFPLIETVASDRSVLAQGRHAKSFDSMGSEFALLLSLIVESSGAPAVVLDAEFQRVLSCYTQTRYPRRTANETGIIKELEAAFQTLYVQPKPIRQAFVQHCLEIVQHDGYVARSEIAMLDLFAASLGCEELAAA